MSVKKLFQIDVGVDEDTKSYVGQVMILSERDGFEYRTPSLRTLFPKVKKLLTQKDSAMRRFPLPEESRILSPNGHKMMVVPR